MPKHKKNPEVGTKETVFDKVVYVTQKDARTFGDNEEVSSSSIFLSLHFFPSLLPFPPPSFTPSSTSSFPSTSPSSSPILTRLHSPRNSDHSYGLGKRLRSINNLLHHFTHRHRINHNGTKPHRRFQENLEKNHLAFFTLLHLILINSSLITRL